MGLHCSRTSLTAAWCAFVASASLSTAHAGFVGYSTEITNVGPTTVVRLYANFNSSNDVVLSVFGVQNFSAFDWDDSDLVGGSWAPQFTTDATVDSYLTIGGTAGFSNTTSADPTWGAAGFNQAGIPNGAGWFNSNPPNLQGKVDALMRTFLGQFAVTNGSTSTPSMSPLTISFNQGLGTQTSFAQGTFNFLPTPGAIALLGLSPLFRGRRRGQRSHGVPG